METSDVNQVDFGKIHSVKKILSTASIVLMLAFFASCNSNDDPAPATPNPPPPPPNACKIQTQTASGMGRESATVTYTYQYTFSYAYDEHGNRVSESSTYKYDFSDGKKATSTSSASNQFDDNGFLIKSVMQYASTNKDGVASSQSNNSEYEYANDRLIKESHHYINNGVVKDYSSSYEYDADGKVVKVVNTYDNSYTKYEWNGNKLFKMTRVDQYGNSVSPYLEYNAQGWLVKSIRTYSSTSDEMRFEYDSEGQVIRTERYINAKPSSAWTNEFDKKDNPYLITYAKLKGHPILPAEQPYNMPKHNYLKTSSYNANPTTDAWELASSTVYEYDYNAKNLPVEVITKTTDSGGIQTNSSRTS
jgi:hypothetical protein